MKHLGCSSPRPEVNAESPDWTDHLRARCVHSVRCEHFMLRCSICGMLPHKGQYGNTDGLSAPVCPHPGEAPLTKIAQKAKGSSDARECGTKQVEVCRGSLLTQRFSKTVLGLGMVAVLSAIPVQRLAPNSGVEAVVNAPVVTLSAQIDGDVSKCRAEAKECLSY